MGASSGFLSRGSFTDVSHKNLSVSGARLLPQILAVFAQVNDGVNCSFEKFEGDGSSFSIAEKYGYGSPIHQAALQLYPEVGAAAPFKVVFFPVKTPESAVAATGKIGATGTASKSGSGKIILGGKSAEFAVAKGDEAETILNSIKDAINSVLSMPAKAGEIADSELPLTAKWSGESSNRISIIIESNIEGVELSVTDFDGGSVDPKEEIKDAFKKMGQNEWFTCLLNTWDYKNTDILDLFYAEGDARWQNTIKMPAFSIVGCSDAYEVRTAISDARKDDFISGFGISVGSPETPATLAARNAFFALKTFNSNPAQNVKDTLTGIMAGSDEVQENYTVRNNSIQKGSSTNVKSGSNAKMNDFVTFYHPLSAGKYPSKRYFVDIVKLQNVVYNVRQIMEDERIIGAPLLPDEAITVNPTAVQPKMIRTMLMNLADSLEKHAIIADAAYTKENLMVEIDSENPKRLNTAFPIKLSGNVEVTSNDIYFDFYFGGAE